MCLWEIKQVQGLEFFIISVSMALTVKRGYLSRRQRAYCKFVVKWPRFSHVLDGACFYLPFLIPVWMVQRSDSSFGRCAEG